MDVSIDVSSKDFVLAAWDRVFLALWRGKTTLAGLRRAGELVPLLFGSRQEPILMLTVIEEGAPLPPLEVRVELVSFLKRVNGLIDRSAIVFEGDGFKATSVRAVVAGVSLFSRPDYPHRVFGSVGSAARFLAGGKNGSPPPHRVLRMVNEARRAPESPTFLPWVPAPDQTSTAPRPR